MLSVTFFIVVLNVPMLSIIMLNVVMLSVIMLNGIMLSVVLIIVVAPTIFLVENGMSTIYNVCGGNELKIVLFLFNRTRLKATVFVRRHFCSNDSWPTF